MKTMTMPLEEYVQLKEEADRIKKEFDEWKDSAIVEIIKNSFYGRGREITYYVIDEAIQEYTNKNFALVNEINNLKIKVSRYKRMSVFQFIKEKFKNKGN